MCLMLQVGVSPVKNGIKWSVYGAKRHSGIFEQVAQKILTRFSIELIIILIAPAWISLLDPRSLVGKGPIRSLP